jgi:hypothetical protein
MIERRPAAGEDRGGLKASMTFLSPASTIRLDGPATGFGRGRDKRREDCEALSGIVPPISDLIQTTSQENPT